MKMEKKVYNEPSENENRAAQCSSNFTYFLFVSFIEE
jgi:hypothetical protein